MSVPTLNYQDFTSGTQQQRQEFSQALLDSFERTGFAKLKCHPFDAQNLQNLFGWGKKFFDQPLDVKQEIPNETGPKPMRGYTQYRVEEVGKLHEDEDVRKMTDSKEHFDQGPEHDTEYANKWPKSAGMADFRPFMEEFYRECDKTCLTLMAALEVAWGIDDGSLVARCVPSATDLRLTHYPEIAVEELATGKNSRIAPHTDFGPITLLFQDSTGGLEIEDRSVPGVTTFVPLPPTDTTEMIVNVGDTLTRWTNGRIAGGIHQVTTPQTMKGDNGTIIPSRMSMAYLFKAERNISVGPLPKFVSEQEPAIFPDITALEFQRWRNSMVYNVDKKHFAKGFGRSTKQAAKADIPSILKNLEVEAGKALAEAPSKGCKTCTAGCKVCPARSAARTSLST